MATTDATDTTDAPQDTAQETQDAPVQVSAGAAGQYCKRQVGLIGILLIVSGVAQLGNLATGEVNTMVNAIVNCIVYCLMGLGMLWFQVEDKGDYLLVTSGPCRWMMCGWGKEKVKYSEIRDYETTKTCLFGEPGYPCTGIRLMNQCSCCQCGFCAPSASYLSGGCCGQTTIRLAINERHFGTDAHDPERDCCLEGCCLRNCFGAKCGQPCLGGVCGEGCIFSMCFNPCGVNCMTMNTMFISTNDPQGLIALLNNKCNKEVTI